MIQSTIQKILSSRTYTNILLMVLFMTPFANNYSQHASRTDLLSAGKRLQFGNYLYKDKDYLRAANEFKEYLQTSSNDTIQFRLSNCLYKMGMFTEATDNFKGLFFSPTISSEARLMFYEANFFQNDFNAFRNLADQTVYISQKYKKEIDRLKFTTYFFDNTELPDENVLLQSFPDSVQSQIAKFYIQKKFPLHKSPTTAAILSTLLPGAGKIYTGEIGDGITALVTTALSAYLAYTNFKADHQFRGWLFTGLTAFFYGGNIYGSAASAQIYNARIRFDFDREVKFYFEQRNYFLPQIDL